MAPAGLPVSAATARLSQTLAQDPLPSGGRIGYDSHMPRRKIIPDHEVFAQIRHLIVASGDKAATFGAVSRATGLAAPTLVQRYGSQEGMVRAALMAAWDDLDQRTEAAEADAELSPKGAQAMLKALGSDAADAPDLTLLAADFRDPPLRARAERWRARMEQALSLRFGGGAKGKDMAAILFAAWQGQVLWQAAGGKSFRLKDAIKRLD